MGNEEKLRKEFWSALEKNQKRRPCPDWLHGLLADLSKKCGWCKQGGKIRIIVSFMRDEKVGTLHLSPTIRQIDPQEKIDEMILYVWEGAATDQGKSAAQKYWKTIFPGLRINKIKKGISFNLKNGKQSKLFKKALGR